VSILLLISQGCR